MNIRTRARQRARKYRNKKHMRRFAVLINKSLTYLDKGRWTDLAT